MPQTKKAALRYTFIITILYLRTFFKRILPIEGHKTALFILFSKFLEKSARCKGLNELKTMPPAPCPRRAACAIIVTTDRAPGRGDGRESGFFRKNAAQCIENQKFFYCSGGMRS